MKNSAIGWTDHTFNPWIGCTKVSPGCTHCYAEGMNKRWRNGENWGPGAPRSRTSESNWKGPLDWNRKAGIHQEQYDNAHDGTLRQAFRPDTLPDRPRRPRVFCASLADWLDDEVPTEWLCNLLETIHACQNLDWLMLTKRPQNWEHRIAQVLMFANQNENRESRDAERHDAFYHWLNLWLNMHQPPENIWIGTTVEDQERAKERIPLLLKIPAVIRFLSVEPMLERINLVEWLYDPTPETRTHGGRRQMKVVAKKDSGIDWIICGGESGPGCRPMDTLWADFLLQQAKGAGISFFMKQMGGSIDKRHDLEDLPPALRVREFPQVEVAW
jgi:protein gp37